jgi:hypothetical protein
VRTLDFQAAGATFPNQDRSNRKVLIRFCAVRGLPVGLLPDDLIHARLAAQVAPAVALRTT